MVYALELDAVSKHYSRHVVLSDICLKQRAGEFIALVGVNGVGKTTLIKCLLDFTSLTSGAIDIFGLPCATTRARQQLAFLPEKFLPPYYLTGKDFLTYSLKLHKADYLEKEATAIFAILGLEPGALIKPVRQYSKGMAQKLGLAACFLSRKALLIFDEPMSGLDPITRANLKHYLLDLKQTGVSVFFSTHLLADADMLCDRILVLHRGQSCFLGSPALLCDTYHASSLEEAYLRCIKDKD